MPGPGVLRIVLSSPRLSAPRPASQSWLKCGVIIVPSRAAKATIKQRDQPRAVIIADLPQGFVDVHAAIVNDHVAIDDVEQIRQQVRDPDPGRKRQQLGPKRLPPGGNRPARGRLRTRLAAPADKTPITHSSAEIP